MAKRGLMPPERVLVRAVNWVGDAVMTLPAMDQLARACPGAAIDVLAKPWVAAVYRGHPAVRQVLTLESEGRHKGLMGRLRLARWLAGRGYDWAVLWQNAFDAALIAWLAGIPRRIGYARDGRRPLLTTAVPCPPAARDIHETSYYLRMLAGAGLMDHLPPDEGVRPALRPRPEDLAWADGFIAGRGLGGRPLIGVAPGAAFGPAKCWPAANFAAAAAALAGELGAGVLLFGSQGEAGATGRVAALLGQRPHADLAGATDLGQALALLARLRLLLTNDSGLMHAAAALGVATVAVFGSTNPATTAPLGPRVALARKDVCPQAPCKKPVCPLGDPRCLSAVEPAEVVAAARRLLAKPAAEQDHA